MADVQHADAADKIQVALAVHIPQLGTLGAIDHQGVSGDQPTGHELIALTEQMRGFVDFAVHGISHRESGNRKVVAMVFRLRRVRNELSRTCPVRNSDQLFCPCLSTDPAPGLSDDERSLYPTGNAHGLALQSGSGARPTLAGTVRRTCTVYSVA